MPVVNDALNMIGITSKGYLYTYLISTTIGYELHLFSIEKLHLKLMNPTLSMILYAIMVVFTIFANGWIGSAMTTFAQSHNLTGNLFWDLVIKLIGMTIPTLWTYPCNRFIIHRRKKSTIEAEMAAESLSGRLNMKTESMLSAGIDIGTTTTHLVISRIGIGVTEGFGTVPSVHITSKKGFI